METKNQAPPTQAKSLPEALVDIIFKIREGIDLGQKVELKVSVDVIPPIKIDTPNQIAPNGIIKKMREVKLEHMMSVLKSNNGAKEKTARDLGIDRKTLYRLIKDSICKA